MQYRTDQTIEQNIEYTLEYNIEWDIEWNIENYMCRVEYRKEFTNVHISQ